jgi:hypothetical protein
MERDKTLVTLSAAAIGLLVTILTTVGVNRFRDILLFAVAILSFIATIWISLTIYQLNSQHLELAIKGSSEGDPRLEKYDKWSMKTFIVGAVAALLIGISSASHHLMGEKEKAMPDRKSSGNPTTLKESVNGVTNLTPSSMVFAKKSLDGITNLRPQATQQTTQEQTQGQTQSNQTTPSSPSGVADGGEK